MKKIDVEHVLRAAGDITGEKQFIIIGSQSIHAKHPDMFQAAMISQEVDLIAKKRPERTEMLNVIGVDSPFHEMNGYYADPVDMSTAILPKGWQGRLVNLPTTGASNDVVGLCLDPHDLLISKYYARREKDVVFNREVVSARVVKKEVLLARLNETLLSDEVKTRIRGHIEHDFRTTESGATY